MITVPLAAADVTLIRSALDITTVKGPQAMRALVTLADAIPVTGANDAPETPYHLILAEPTARVLVEVLNTVPVAGLDNMARVVGIAQRTHRAAQEHAAVSVET